MVIYGMIQIFNEDFCDVWDIGFEDFYGGFVYLGGEQLFGIFVVLVEGLGLYVQFQDRGVLVFEVQ